MPINSLPKLIVTTKPISNALAQSLNPAEKLIALADAHDPLVWLKNYGFVGQGRALDLRFTGASRFADASRAWQQISRDALVSDPLERAGTGLTAFASFTFADASPTESILIVPKIIIGRDEEGAWITTIAATGEADPVASLTAKPYGQEPDASFFEPAGEASAYREGVLEAGRRIGVGAAEKIVLARRLQTDLPADTDLRFPLQKLAARYTDCATFAVDGMLGASPETLIRSVEGHVSARVLAGTRKRNIDSVRDIAMRDELQNSLKEQHEHRLAVQSLVETLTPYVTELVADPEPHLLQLPNVWHLATNVHAKLAHGADVLELSGAVHPTAAVAGTPTPLAVAAIGELEPFDRGRYAGAVGWLNSAGDGEFAIALRCAQVSGGGQHAGIRVTAFAGGGLVEGSDPWHELTETVAKFRPIIEAFSR